MNRDDQFTSQSQICKFQDSFTSINQMNQLNTQFLIRKPFRVQKAQKGLNTSLQSASLDDQPWIKYNAKLLKHK